MGQLYAPLNPRHSTAMKSLLVVALAAMAAGQQFQQQRQFNTAVRLASPGYFQQGGSFTSDSFRSNSGRFQSDSSQSNNLQNNQGSTFRSGTSGFSTFRQSGSFHNHNQFQGEPFQENQRNSFDANAFQQNSGNRFQETNSQQNANSFYRSNSNQFNSNDRIQVNS